MSASEEQLVTLRNQVGNQGLFNIIARIDEICGNVVPHIVTLIAHQIVFVTILCHGRTYYFQGFAQFATAHLLIHLVVDSTDAQHRRNNHSLHCADIYVSIFTDHSLRTAGGDIGRG